MKRNKEIIIFELVILFFTLLCTTGSFAQNPTDSLLEIFSSQERVQFDSIGNDQKNIQVLTKNYGDSIVVRWAPEGAGNWLNANRYGYRISRIEMEIGAFSNPDNYKVIQDSILPLDQSTWVKYIQQNTTDKYAAIGLECIYGDFQSLGLERSMGAMVMQSNELTNKYSFALFAADMDVRTANFSALRFVDKNIQSNKCYLYQIESLVPDSMNTLLPGFSRICTDAVTKDPIVQFDVLEEEQRITLKWLREAYNPFYTAYHIEKSIDGKKFERLNENPYVHGLSNDGNLYTPYIIFSDSVANYQPAYYRVIGISPFAELSPYDKGTLAQGRDRTPPQSPTQVKAIHFPDNSMTIQWEMIDASSDFAGFNIYKNRKFEGNYQQLNKTLLSPNVKEFTEAKINEFDKHYYYVSAVDTAGNESNSLIAYGMIKDTIPPTKPEGVEAIVDSNGVVQLKWEWGKEFDIKGYKVFFANAKYHEFSIVHADLILDNQFTDTIPLNVLSKHVYYQVMAVDERFNYSPLSEIIEVKRPDIIPPSPPLFKDYKVGDKQVYLKWANSSSNDILKHELYRRAKGNTYQLILTMTDSRTEYFDTEIRAGNTYDYKLIAYDDSGLTSEGVNPIQVRITSKNEVLPIANLQIYLDEKDGRKMVSLKWDYPAIEGIQFLIFRSENNKGFKQLTSIKYPQLAYFDKGFKEGNTYEYTIQVVNEKGLKSAFCEKINFK